MILTDTHAHFYLPEFDDDRELLFARAKAAGVKLILMPAIDSQTHENLFAVEAGYEGCMAMMGLHPCSVTEKYEKELEIVSSLLEKRNFIAVGEIGLDFYWDTTFTKQQYYAFNRQIELAMRADLPIVIHSRNATDECIEVVKAYPGLRGVFHCFSGTLEQAEKIVELNFFLGIGGVVTFKNSGLDRIIEKNGLNQVILETDAPYLAPVPFRGKRNEPSFVVHVADKISQVLGISREEVASLTFQNATKLFELKE